MPVELLLVCFVLMIVVGPGRMLYGPIIIAQKGSNSLMIRFFTVEQPSSPGA